MVDAASQRSPIEPHLLRFFCFFTLCVFINHDVGLNDCDENNSILFVVFHSESGTFLGLGTVTGSVAVYVTFSLQVKIIMDRYLTNLCNSFQIALF